MKQLKNRVSLKFLVGLVFVGVISYILFLTFNVKTEIVNTRNNNDFNIVDNYNYYEIESKDTPVGKIRVFEWKINNSSQYDRSIAFFCISQLY